MRGALALLTLLLSPIAAADPSPTLLIAGPPGGPDPAAEQPADYFVPLLCRGGPRGVRGGAACLAASRPTALRTDDGVTRRTRRAGNREVCYTGMDDGVTRIPRAPALRLRAAAPAVAGRTLAVTPPDADARLLQPPALSLDPGDTKAIAAVVRANPRRTLESQLEIAGRWDLDVNGDGAVEHVYSVRLVDGRGMPPPFAAVVILDRAGGATIVLGAGRIGPNQVDLVGASDVDGDGQLELVLHESWVNDYGVAVYEGLDPAPVYAFSCGSV